MSDRVRGGDESRGAEAARNAPGALETELGSSGFDARHVNRVGRAGFAVQNNLFYIRGGYAGVNNRLSVTDPVVTGTGGQTHWHNGWTVGAGWEYGITRNWIVGLEYAYAAFEKKSYQLAGTAAPGITDITPYWRPASWAAGVVVVDALSWGEADEGLIDRWNALPEWPQMLLRALMFRLAVHALHPRSTAAAFPGLARTAALVRLVL